ncbi:MAG: type II toxin-antitoxin system HicA family toxin [Selenomonadaceae bacterium]|nr:type II toxin-antitoxin system HicA family toxin [Selenomonadaceae bacterium]
MSKWEKLLEKIRNNPKTVTFEEVDKVMKRLGYDGKFPRGGSSHCIYRKPGHTPVTVPRYEPYVKEEYVKQVIEAMDEE